MAKLVYPITLPKARITTAEDAGKLVPVRVSKYAEVIATLVALKPGQAAVFAFDKDTHVQRVRNAITTVMQNYKVKAPVGHAFYKSVGKNNELVIRVLPRKARSAAKRSAK